MIMRKTLWILFLLANIKSKCLELKNDSEELLAIELQKLGVEKNKLTLNLDYSKVFQLLTEPQNKFKLMEFDLTNAEVKESFEFRKNIFFEPKTLSHFAYTPYCFQIPKKGYLLFVMRDDFIKFVNCPKPKASDSKNFMSFLGTLFQIFIYYETREIGLGIFGTEDVGCSKKDTTIPLITDVNILYERNDNMFKHFYKKSLSLQGKLSQADKLIPIYKPPTQKPQFPLPADKVKKAPPMVWNAYSFIQFLTSTLAWIQQRYTFDQLGMKKSSNMRFVLYLLQGHFKSFEDRKIQHLGVQEIKEILKYLPAPELSNSRRMLKTEYLSYPTLSRNQRALLLTLYK